MRKLLSLLSVLTVGTVASTNVVACTNKSSISPADQTNLPFLYHVAQVTNLGNVKKDADSILAAFKKVNPVAKDDATLKVTNITDKTAIINVDEYDTNFKKGTLNVTFNTIQSDELAKLVTVTNLVVSRNVDLTHDPKVTNKDVVDGINAANGLALTTDDVTIVLKGHHTSFTTGYPDKSSLQAVVTAVKSSKFKGEITVLLNKNLDLSTVFTNTNIGTISLSPWLIANWTSSDPSCQLVLKAFLIEFIGDANPLLAEYKDVIANIQFANSKTALTFDKTHLTLDAKDIKDNPLSEYFKNSVTFNFTLQPDKRLKINDAIKTTNLDTIKDTNLDTIKDAIIDKNQAQLKQYDRNEIKRYLVVTLNKDNKSATVTWLPGSKQFLGHDELAMRFAPQEVQKEVGKLTATVSFTTGK